jgi:hypothetical protein
MFSNKLLFKQIKNDILLSYHSFEKPDRSFLYLDHKIESYSNILWDISKKYIVNDDTDITYDNGLILGITKDTLKNPTLSPNQFLWRLCLSFVGEYALLAKREIFFQRNRFKVLDEKRTDFLLGDDDLFFINTIKKHNVRLLSLDVIMEKIQNFNLWWWTGTENQSQGALVHEILFYGGGFVDYY